MEGPWFKKNINIRKNSATVFGQHTLATASALWDEDELASAALLEMVFDTFSAALEGIGVNIGEALPLEQQLPTTMERYVHDAPTSARNPEGAKHRLQQASIVGHLAKAQAIGLGDAEAPCHNSYASVFVELGAGSGFLSSALRHGSPPSRRQHFYLIDRDTPPLRRGDARFLDKSRGGRSERLKCDIADCALSGLGQDCSGANFGAHPPRRCCTLGKHVCGGGTDLALMATTLSQIIGPRGTEIRYLAFAPCCYHRFVSLHLFPPPPFFCLAFSNEPPLPRPRD